MEKMIKEKMEELSRETWVAAVESTDRIFRETVREAMARLSQKDFYKWLSEFVSEREDKK